jgi:hypothetical protein
LYNRYFIILSYKIGNRTMTMRLEFQKLSLDTAAAPPCGAVVTQAAGKVVNRLSPLGEALADALESFSLDVVGLVEDFIIGSAEDTQKILEGEAQNQLNYSDSSTSISKISMGATWHIAKHGPSQKAINLYDLKLSVYRTDWFEKDKAVSHSWSSKLLSGTIYPALKSVERLKLPDCSETAISINKKMNRLTVNQLPFSLRHLELSQKLRGDSVAVIYAVDRNNKELNQFLYQLLCKMCHRRLDCKGPELESLKLTYRKGMIDLCLPALMVLQEKREGVAIQFVGKSTLAIAVRSPKVSIDDVYLDPNPWPWAFPNDLAKMTKEELKKTVAANLFKEE